MFGDPEVMRYVGAERRPLDRKGVATLLASAEAQWQRQGFGLLAVVERETGRLVGEAGLQPLEAGPDIEFGYTLARAVWGRGYATEAARAVLRWAFAGLRLHRVVAVADPANAASLHVLDKLGMRRLRRPALLQRQDGRVRPSPSASGGRSPGRRPPDPEAAPAAAAALGVRRGAGRWRVRLYSPGDTARLSPATAARSASRPLSRHQRRRGAARRGGAPLARRSWRRRVSGAARAAVRSRAARAGEPPACSRRARSRAPAAPASGRYSVTSRSPLTGTVFDGNSGGNFGNALRRLGWDYLVVTGALDEPGYVTVGLDAAAESFDGPGDVSSPPRRRSFRAPRCPSRSRVCASCTRPARPR